MLVLEKIKKFAVHIDCASVDPNDNRDIEIEGWSAGLGHLIRQDVVTIVTPANVRKERALFLFADSIVVASIKRKTTMRKTSYANIPFPFMCRYLISSLTDYSHAIGPTSTNHLVQTWKVVNLNCS